MALIPRIKFGNWRILRQRLQKIATYKLGPESTPTFAGISVQGTLAVVSITGTYSVVSVVAALPAPGMGGEVVFLNLASDNNLYVCKGI